MNYATFAAPCLKQLHFCIKETNDFQCKDENIKMAEQLSLKQVNCHCTFHYPTPPAFAGKLLKMVYGH